MLRNNLLKYINKLPKSTSIRSNNVIRRTFASENDPNDPFKPDPDTNVIHHLGYRFTADDPSHHIEKNPYVDGIAHYRDQLQDEYKDLQFRDYLGIFVMMGLFPAFLLWGLREEERCKLAVHGVKLAQFPDTIPDEEDNEN